MAVFMYKQDVIVRYFLCIHSFLIISLASGKNENQKDQKIIVRYILYYSK